MALPKQSYCRPFFLLALLCAIGFLTAAIVPLMPQSDNAPRLTRFHSHRSKVILPPSHGADQQAALTDPHSITFFLLAAASLSSLSVVRHVNPNPNVAFFKMLLSLYKRKANYVPLQVAR